MPDLRAADADQPDRADPEVEALLARDAGNRNPGWTFTRGPDPEKPAKRIWTARHEASGKVCKDRILPEVEKKIRRAIGPPA